MNQSCLAVLWHNTRYVQGVLALLGVVVCWVGSSFAVQGMFTDYEYSKPFFLTYFNTCTFTLYLGVYWATTAPADRHWARGLESHQAHHEAADETAPLLRAKDGHTTPSLSAKFCVLWFLANWSQNASLAYTSVASSTVIGSTSGLFTLLIGSMAGVERLTLARCVAALCSLVGVALVTNAPAHLPDPVDEAPSLVSHLWGDALALMGAFFYGCYTVLLKCRMHDDTQANNTLFFGLVGLFNMVGMWPFLLLLHCLGWETFALPDVPVVWAIILVNAFLGTFLSDYLWLLAVLLTSPLVATLGLALSIPLAFFGDIVFKGLVVNATYWIGTGLVLCGFLGVNSATLWEQSLPAR
ncbi:hypothetical protein SYNPS1DRAFT_15354 [Syncephalis pseudoplumigaleata]|uniref:Uncharacterized protein n=1 Tax=Syncephalis pseudoplumigaleata TaxID=1712513 RepID=A0A4V1J1N3_9FUNG|nr:hypothetical protein SYNPS1DRAFT_15354 [Syncephalis pseudoplumigaleata]|eukprot:RKP25659.1 hypothetical protein SYNPS1DRAFT_15354 [Syncephalis pseudoplumigaleata]